MEREDARKLSPAEQMERRRQVIRAWKRGRNRRQISAEIGLSYSAVRATINSYKELGARGLEPGKRGRPVGSCRVLGREQEERVQRLIQEKRPEQMKMDFALWTRAAVMVLIEHECGVKIGVRGVGKYLERWGFTPQMPIRRA